MSLYTLFLKSLNTAISLVYVIFLSAKTKLLGGLLIYDHYLCFNPLVVMINHEKL